MVTLVPNPRSAVELEVTASKSVAKTALTDNTGELSVDLAEPVDDHGQRHAGDTELLLEARLDLIGHLAHRGTGCLRNGESFLAAPAGGRGEHDETGIERTGRDIQRWVIRDLSPSYQSNADGETSNRKDEDYSHRRVSHQRPSRRRT